MKSCFDILVYHRIGQENSFDGLTVSRKTFSEQMEYIKRDCQPIPLGEIVQLLLQKKEIPARAVAVTFDDGYADTFNIALPILKRAQIPATVFITTGYVDGKVLPSCKAPMLSWKMVKQIQRSGFEIGAHTLTHPNLTQCNPREVKRQMTKSRTRLEEKIQKPVQLFAYPYGGVRSFNKMTQACAREAGFLAACTTLSGSNSADTDLYALRRKLPLRDEVRDLVVQLNQIALKKSLNSRSVRGVTKRTMQIWASQYQEIGERVSCATDLG